jgi:hypothetical protein
MNGEVIEVYNPSKFPDPSVIKQIEEPIIDATVITREEYLGEILKLLEEKRGYAEEVRIHRHRPRDADVRDAAERDRAGFLRPAEIGVARLCVARLSSGRLPRFARW